MISLHSLICSLNYTVDSSLLDWWLMCMSPHWDFVLFSVFINLLTNVTDMSSKPVFFNRCSTEHRLSGVSQKFRCFAQYNVRVECN